MTAERPKTAFVLSEGAGPIEVGMLRGALRAGNRFGSDHRHLGGCAERLGTTRGALYKTIHDARKKLRAHLGDAGLRFESEAETAEATR